MYICGQKPCVAGVSAMTRWRFYLIGMVLFLAPAPALAHNGAVAIAVPVAGITI